MPLFDVNIEKMYGSEFWTNRYVVQAADVTAAHAIGMAIYGYERSIHKFGVLFTKVRTSDRVIGTDVYVLTEPNTQGSVAVPAGSALPLFNCVRVDFGVESGRPSRKYLRLPLFTSEVAAGDAVSNAVVTAVNTSYATPLVNEVGFVDVDNQSIITGAAKTGIAMRQLRRGSKRRQQPVLT